MHEKHEDHDESDELNLDLMDREETAPQHDEGGEENKVAKPHETECPICCDTAEMVVPYGYGHCGTVCTHEACTTCWDRYIDGQLPRCREENMLRATCMFCPKALPQRMVLETCGTAAKLADQLERRFRLEENTLYPQELQVNCKRLGR